jgi:Holliday junction resolvasome RuvABC endonuclease subunit
MTILALDLGTKTGWATKNPDGVFVYGVNSFKPQRFEGGGMRYLRFRSWLDETVKMLEVDAVYFEEVRAHAGTDAAHIYGGLMATLTAYCEAQRIPYAGVGVGTIKKSATGKGNASKQQMIAAMKAKGHSCEDDNEADALAILYWAIESTKKAA